MNLSLLVRPSALGLTGVLVLAACSASVVPSGPADPTVAGSPELDNASPWRTDFERRADGIELDQFVRALPRRDAIPAIDAPHLVEVKQVDWIGADEPVMAVELGGEWRAYPLQILLWHEIANDELGGRPITVTFCPLCHTGVVFDRQLDGEILDFGVTGYLRRSDLVMYDRQTETWWQQATGVGLIGEHAGRHLEILASSLVSWSTFVAGHPDATVLDRPAGSGKPYGRNPYPGWDQLDRNPFLGAAQLEACDGAEQCLDAKERIGVVTVEDETVVFPFRAVADTGGLVETDVGGTPVVVWWLPDVSSVLDNQLLERSDQVGTLVAFDRRVDGSVLSFELHGQVLRDADSGIEFDAFGMAVGGSATEARLTRLQVDTPYWFGFAAFGSGYRIWAMDAESTDP